MRPAACPPDSPAPRFGFYVFVTLWLICVPLYIEENNMVEKAIVASVEHIEQVILLIRGQKVILAADLAGLYGVTTKRLNEQVKRNRERFPEDFLFQLTTEEKNELVANCDHLSNLKFSPKLPYAFTEHGAIMAASVLNSEQAIETSIFVV